MGRLGNLVDWTPETIDRVKRRVLDDGFSAAQVAAEIGATRNAVIGKLHRLGVFGGPLVKRAPRPDRRPPSQASLRPTEPGLRVGQGVRLRSVKGAKPRANRDVPAPDSVNLRFAELEARSCRWAIGEPDDDGFRFCGADVEPDHPYCPHHCGVAYVRPVANPARNQCQANA